MSDTPDPPFTVPAGEMIDRLCDEFEAGWLAGRPVPLEDVIRAAPEAVRSDLLRELLTVERAYRERDARPITAGEAQGRFAAFGPWAAAVVEEVLGATGSWVAPPPSHRPGHFSPDPFPAPLPETAGGYRVVRELGRGGMGVVYLVEDRIGHRQLAVKMMLPEVAADPIARERFLREARSASAVEHDNVVAIYEVKEGNGTPYLVMPLLKGESLEQRLQREPYSPPVLVLKVGREVALGLQAAHDKGLVHRDVKPSNTWLEGDPKADALDEQVRRVKVLDFGLARPAEGGDGVSVTGSVVGTPAYMAPEQARGEKVDGRADLFSLGAILYRMATGRPAFAGPTLTAVLTAIATHNPPPAAEVNPAVPPALSELIMRLLAKRPDDRAPSAVAVAGALNAVESGTPTALVRRESVPARWWLKAVVCLALAVLLLVGVGVWLGARPPKSPNDGETAKGAPASAGAPQPARQSPPVPEQLPPVTVSKLDVRPHQHLGGEQYKPLLLFGREGNAVATVEEALGVSVTLSRPAYCYLIVFRADGVDAVLYPQDDTDVPEKTDRPLYPSKRRNALYGLDDGPGLWAVAVVTSNDPLPSYREWRQKHPGGPWKAQPTPPAAVMLDDGVALETFVPGQASTRGSRGEKVATDRRPVVELVDWLKAQTGSPAAALAFPVRTMK